MKRVILITLTAIGLAQGGRAANLTWAPTDANWNTTTANWTNPSTGGSLVAYTEGDSVRFDDAGLIQPAVTLSGALTPGSVVVDSTGTYSLLTGTLAGSVPLFKRGTGLLILGSNNTISSPTSIEGGQLQIGSGGSTGSVGTGWITNLSGLIINRTGTLNLNNSMSGAGGFTNKLGATVNLWGTNTMSGPIFIQVGQLSLSNAPSLGSSSTIILDGTSASAANSRLVFAGGINLPSGTTISMMNTIASPLTRCTIGTANPADTAINSVNGPILIGSGNGAIQFNAVSTGTGELQINGSISNHPDNLTPFSGQFFVRGSGNGTLSGTVNLPNASFIRTDAGTFTISSTGNSWAGTLIAVGQLRLGADNALPTSIPFSIGQGAGTNAILDLNGHSQQLPGVTSVHAANPNVPIIASSSTTSDSTLTISAPAGIYGGFIQDSISGGTRKLGLQIIGGAQQLTTNCTYSGPTTILAGGLVLKGSGSISNTASIDITAPATLDASLRTDGTLWLGASQTLKGNGTFNITGTLASQGTIELKADKTGGTVSNDKVAVSGQMTYGGTLKLLITGDPLDTADYVSLFSAGGYAGAFASIVPARPGPGLAWDTSTLTTDGTLRIVSSIPTTPTNITVTVVAGGTQLQLAWPDDYTGWTLQGQTNAPTVGLTANWFDVPDSAATNRLFIPISTADGSVFYRLRYQP